MGWMHDDSLPGQAPGTPELPDVPPAEEGPVLALIPWNQALRHPVVHRYAMDLQGDGRLHQREKVLWAELSGPDLPANGAV